MKILAIRKGYHFGSFCLALGLHNLLLLLLFGAFHKEDRSLSFLLGHLLGFHCGGVFLAKTQLCQGHVVQDDVEVARTFHQLLANKQ